MVPETELTLHQIFTLSVLALSSRFDGRGRRRRSPKNSQLSVLALSSRFDGHVSAIEIG